MFSIVNNRNEKGQEMRRAAVQTLDQLMNENENIIFFDADLAGASGSKALMESHPDQFVEAGISEANMIGMAAGMSTYGMIPFVHSFAPFVSRRVFDQVFLSGAYAGNTLNILGTDPGFAAAANGGTHTTFEDMAMMRTIPNAIVMDACDPVQLAWMMEALCKAGDGVHYVRTTRKAVRPVYEPDSTFEIGKGNVLRQGEDVLIVATGPLVSDALDAAERLEKLGWSTEVIDMFTIKPLDEGLLVEEARGKKAVVTIENHNVIGGLGSAAAEVLMEQGVCVPFKRMGIEEQFGQVGSVDYLQEAFGLTADDLVQTVLALLPAQEDRMVRSIARTPYSSLASILKKACSVLGTTPKPTHSGLH